MYKYRDAANRFHSFYETIISSKKRNNEGEEVGESEAPIASEIAGESENI